MTAQRRSPGRSPAELTRTAVMTTLYAAILLVFLAPLAYAFLTSVKTEAQMSQANSPILPSDPRTFEWEG
jgi:ABC-type glycerol-3-phosphate transport system permease component